MKSLPTYEIVSNLKVYMESILDSLLEDIDNDEIKYRVKYEIYDSLLWDLGIYRQAGTRVLGIDINTGYASIFDDIPDCLTAGYEYVKDVYLLKSPTINKEDMPDPIEVRVPEFSLSIPQSEIILPDGTKRSIFD